MTDYPENVFLILCRSLHSHNYKPRALAVLDVSPDLASHLWITETIQEIILETNVRTL